MKKKIITIKLLFPKERYPKPVKIIHKAIYKLPVELGEFLIKNPIGFSIEYKDRIQNAFFLRQEDFKDYKYLIHLNYHIWEIFDEKEIIKIILHEIAHIYLRHSADVTLKRYQKQEKEADKLMENWLRL